MAVTRKSTVSAAQDSAAATDGGGPGFTAARQGGPVAASHGPLVIHLGNGDTLIIAANNTGTLDTGRLGLHDGDVFLFAPNNQGSIVASSHETDVDTVTRNAGGPRNATAEAHAMADADLWIFAPGNTGSISGTAWASAEATARATAAAGKATAQATASADADVIIYDPGNLGSVQASASAEARAAADASGNAATATLATTLASAEVLVTPVFDQALRAAFLEEIGGFGRFYAHLLDAWLA